MTWLVLILVHPSPYLRWLALTGLMQKPPNDLGVQELVELRRTDPLVQKLTASQAAACSWGAGDLPGSPQPRHLLTSQVLLRLGYLGLREDHPAVAGHPAG